MVSIVEEISWKFNILEGVITISCDGLNAIKKSMDIETRYAFLSNQFDLIPAIDHKIIKYPLIWYWRHVKGHQDHQIGTLDIWATLNVECNTLEKHKWEEYQESGFPKLQSHNIQDENWRLFTSAPTYPDRKRNIELGDKFYTNLKYSIDKSTFKKHLLSLWHKIYTLHEKYHPQVDWYAIKIATRKSPSRQLR